MPNAFATLALIAWPFVAIGLFRVLSANRALIACLVLAYLFLPPPPAGFDFPLLPPLSKETIPNLALVVICLAIAREPIQWLPKSILARVLLGVFVLAPFATIITNQEPVFYGNTGLPGLRFREAVAVCLQQALFVAPLLLARHFLHNERDQRDVLLALMIGGLVYSLPALIEIRLSPQLNLWIYGYFQHSFEQTIRFGGYRPLVFLYHGIWLAFFMLTSALAALALMRAEGRSSLMIYGVVAGYLLLVLLLCKSAGAILFAALFAPLIVLFGKRFLLNIAFALAVVALAYPALRGAGVVPVEPILAVAQQIDGERAASLDFRFDNEAILLERALEKPVFGWGIWGRNHILDPITGEIETVTDGRWIIVIGVFGWLGFLAEFGLLTLPIFIIWWRGAWRDPSQLSPYSGAIALILAINVIDLIPNATITPMTFLLAGTLLGYAERYVPARRERPIAFETVL